MEENMEIEDFQFNTGRRIAIEPGTELQIKVDGVDYVLKSTLIGIESDKYLIIDVPTNSLYGSINHKYFRGNKIVVRYLYKGTVFGFQTELIEDIYTPLKLLFVKYPEIIENHNLRSTERVDCYLPTKVKINEEEIEGITLDINKKGCGCVFKGTVKSNFQIDELITLRYKFPQIEDEQLALRKVKSIRKDKKQIRLGIIFHEIDSAIEDIIDQYIRSIKELFKSKET